VDEGAEKRHRPLGDAQQLISLSRGYQDKLEESRLNAARKRRSGFEADSTILTMSLSSSFLAFAEALPQRGSTSLSRNPGRRWRDVRRLGAGGRWESPCTLLSRMPKSVTSPGLADSVLVGADSHSSRRLRGE